MKEILSGQLKELIRIVGKRIREINADIQSSRDDLKKVDDYDVVINRIREDRMCFASAEFKSRVESVLADSQVEDKSLLTSAVDDLEYICVLSTFIDSGSFEGYKSSEIEIIERLVSTLEKFKALSLEANNSQNQVVSKKTAELELCTALYDKLRKGEDGIIHFQSNEISYLLSLLNDKSFEYKYHTLELIKVLEVSINNNIMSLLEANSDDYGYEDDKVEEEIEEDVIVDIFKKYGLDFSIFNDKQKSILRTRCDLRRIEDVLEIITSRREYAFVLRYANSYKVNERIREIDVRKLFFIIRFANRETLEYLITDALNRGVTVEEVFAVTGVYKKVSKTKDRLPGEGGEPTDDDYLAGSYEYYKLNAKVFEKLSIEYNAEHPGDDVDFYKQILEVSPDVLSTPAGVIDRNIKFAKEYGIELIDNDHTIKAPTTLVSGIFIHLVDILIENSDNYNDFFVYLNRYPSILKEEKTVRKLLYRLYNGETNLLNPNRTLRGVRSDDPSDLDRVVNRSNIERLLSNVPDSLITYIDEHEYSIDKYVQDDYIDIFDNAPEVNNINGRAYEINGVRVSIMKFKRIWTLIVKSGLADDIDMHTLLMLALTYNSYYRDADIVKLQEYVSSLGLR